jgi:hypothetical protein
MKKSEAVRLGLLLSIAAALTGCSRSRPNIVQRCVNADGTVVADHNCEQQELRDGHGVLVYPYRWYYGGSGLTPGSRVLGGSHDPPGSYNFVRPNSGGRVITGGRTSSGTRSGSSVRGVFGSTGSGHSATS